MKTKLCVWVLLVVATALQAQTTNLTTLLQKGLFEEQANRNLDTAIAEYQSLATQFDKDRQLAATAVFRLGECYRAQGKTNQAATQYRRILSDFSDQTTLATLSRQDLAGMGLAGTTTTTAAVDNTDAALWDKIKHMDRSQLEQALPTLVPDSNLNHLLQQRDESLAKLTQLKVDYSTNNLAVMREQTLLDVSNRQIDEKIRGMMLALKLRAEIHPNQPQETQQKVATVASQPAAPVDEESQEIARIQQLIQNSPDLINIPVKDGLTPLAKASGKGWFRVASFLLSHGANVNAEAGSALFTAMGAGNRGMVQFLLEHGADVNINRAGETPLLAAVRRRFSAIITTLLTNKAEVNVSDSRGDTPLSWAAQLNEPPVVQQLLAGGADINAENNQGWTPLSSAAARGATEIVKMLLAAKADPNKGKFDLPLFSAIHNNDATAARLLLEAGANPNAKEQVDWQPSHNYQWVPAGGGNRGWATPLWLAVNMNEPALVQLLLQFKADPNNSEADGRSALFSALTHTNILESLLDAGAAVDTWDAFQVSPFSPTATGHFTPLLRAVQSATCADSVGILLKHGANLDAHDPQGNTPLHLAAYNLPGSNVFYTLIEAHARLNVRNQGGATPLDILKKTAANANYGDYSETQRKMAGELADLLRQHGALDNLPDWDQIKMARPSSAFSHMVFGKGTNDWNHFTLLEAIAGFYMNSEMYWVRGPNNMSSGFPLNSALPFPDLARVVIVRPSHDSTNVTRIAVNLLNGTNGIDVAKDVPLEFGDTVEIPEREHTLAETAPALSASQNHTIMEYLRSKAGRAKLIVAGGPTVELPLQPLFSPIDQTLRESAAQNVLTSDSDLSRVKVTRLDASTGKSDEWIVDCSDHASSGQAGAAPNTFATRLQSVIQNQNGSGPSSQLLLRNGDVIEVPEK